MKDGSWELEIEIDQRGYQDLKQKEDLQISSTGEGRESATLH